jgi:hypothetical protein
MKELVQQMEQPRRGEILVGWVKPGGGKEPKTRPVVQRTGNEK